MIFADSKTCLNDVNTYKAGSQTKSTSVQTMPRLRVLDHLVTPHFGSADYAGDSLLFKAHNRIFYPACTSILILAEISSIMDDNRQALPSLISTPISIFFSMPRHERLAEPIRAVFLS